ncbi:MAG: amidohydrolase [Oscillospiraceae bacterium]|nr:amidohydrolase [Oscillospiraceae bacterium]
MGIRFYNCRILTLEDYNIVWGEVHTNGNLISYVGDEKNAPKDVKFEREINLNGNLIMPSFKNAHTHSAMSFLRSYADDLPLNDWLFQQVFPMEAKLTGEDIYRLSKLSFAEYLTSGITACFDMYFEPDYMAKAADETGLRTIMCGSVAGSADECDAALLKLDTLYNKFKDHSEFVSYRLGFHAEYTTDVSIMKGIAEMSKKYKQPVYTHNSETASEVQGCKERHNGMTPTELMESLGMFEYGGGGFHCVHMSDSDLDIFKKRGLWAVTNPGSNSKLASGIAPLCRMNEMGINLSVGTDGPASNNALDMFREMYLATVLQKLNLDDAAAMPADIVLGMASKGGALTMGLNDCDTLSVGKKADIIVIDLSQPNMQPINNIVKNIVYSGSKTNIQLTMCNGRVLYEKGEFTTLDIERVYAEAEASTERMKNE